MTWLNSLSHPLPPTVVLLPKPWIVRPFSDQRSACGQRVLLPEQPKGRRLSPTGYGFGYAKNWISRMVLSRRIATKFIEEQSACTGTMIFLILKTPHLSLPFLTISMFLLTSNATAFPFPIFSLRSPIWPSLLRKSKRFIEGEMPILCGRYETGTATLPRAPLNKGVFASHKFMGRKELTDMGLCFAGCLTKVSRDRVPTASLKEKSKKVGQG